MNKNESLNVLPGATPRGYLEQSDFFLSFLGLCKSFLRNKRLRKYRRNYCLILNDLKRTFILQEVS